jgi:hypothetical protein
MKKNKTIRNEIKNKEIEQRKGEPGTEENQWSKRRNSVARVEIIGADLLLKQLMI